MTHTYDGAFKNSHLILRTSNFHVHDCMDESDKEKQKVKVEKFGVDDTGNNSSTVLTPLSRSSVPIERDKYIVRGVQKGFVFCLLVIIVLMNMACVNSPLFRKKVDPYAPSKPEPAEIGQRYNGSIYQEGMVVGMFDNRTAKRKGDILTIELMETASAGAQSSTTTKKENSVDLPSPTVAGDKVTKDGKEVLSNQFDGGRDFSGSGNTSQTHNLSGKITVTVAEVLPNRNLVVRGQKLLNLNQASEFIRISGIVRPEDIKPDNTVLSNRLADAHIIYGDSGTMSSANTMGPLGKFFNSKNYPY